MFRRTLLCLVTAALLGVTAAASAENHSSMTPAASAPGTATSIPLMKDLGDWHREITTQSTEAQQYFDQGLRFLYGFNHHSAEQSFRQAAMADPGCAMCWWGVAMSLGPHINVPAIPERTHSAWIAEQKARTLAPKASPVEKALIAALSPRYREPQPTDPAAELAAETAYADSMRSVAKHFPQDMDVQTLFAEAMMDLRPWDYWTRKGTPQPGTQEIVATLEHVLATTPNHPGANHLYIHALEASPHPEKARASADRLMTLMPGAGHMVHMPSHIYERLGLYDKSVESNRKAVAVDKAFMPYVNAGSFYPMYAAHNQHFLADAAMMEGRSAEAIKAAKGARSTAPLEMMRMMPGVDFFHTVPTFAMIRFGKWDDLLKDPAPPADLRYAKAIWHYGRGMAQAVKGRASKAAIERDSLNAIAEQLSPDQPEDLNSARALLRIAGRMLDAKIAEKSGKTDDAIRDLGVAIDMEDSLHYSEPADWMIPVRQSMGALAMRSGRESSAEANYRTDLAINPNNGWSLYGLAQALKAQKRMIEVKDAEDRFKKAWARADFKLSSSEY
jgi:tetratricopeptide (TPR) repeat protein